LTGGHRLEYETRVNRVIDHIRRHLAEELSLSTLARVAAFSPFHFHRVFRAITGETLFGFIHRLRIEKAAGALLNHPDQSVLAIALDHGFASAATFARAFKTRFGMSATEWRAGGAARWRARHRPERNPGKQLRKAGNASGRVRPHSGGRRTEERSMSVRVRELPPYHVAYMRYVGPYGAHGIPELWTRFDKWMEARGLRPEARVTLGVGYDDPRITAAEHCRYDACVVVPADFPPDRRVNVMDLPGGPCAVAMFTGTADEITDAWDHVFAARLPASAWQPDDRPCVEVYRGRAMVDVKAGVFRCELCLPVKPL
jgi:AraC family transcriptional regulator